MNMVKLRSSNFCENSLPPDVRWEVTCRTGGKKFKFSEDKHPVDIKSLNSSRH